MKTLRYLYMLLLMTACTKTDFLDAKPDDKLVVPTTLTDLQALLDNDKYMNGAPTANGLVPSLGVIGSDEYYLDDAVYDIIPVLNRNLYTWHEELLLDESVYDWSFPYRSIFYANICLEGVEKIQPAASEQDTWNNIKGSALFYRAFMFYHLAQVFAAPYNVATASTEPGIPLRVKADVNEILSRGTLQQTYDKIIEDLVVAKQLLPVQPLYKTRPSVPAVDALLARVYQAMQLYEKAEDYADSCLITEHALLDFNTLNADDFCPIPKFNTEVLFQCSIIFDIITQPLNARIDTVLYNSYGLNDLRRNMYYKNIGLGGITFLGSYNGDVDLFGGLALDEVYLVKAEAAARRGDASLAMATLNTLLEKRYATGYFVPRTALNATDALIQVLAERKKELVFRGLRWTDLRRLNQDNTMSVNLSRFVLGSTYILPPNDMRYTWPIPASVLSFNPGMLQNPR
jgi:hypothetical protein